MKDKKGQTMSDKVEKLTEGIVPEFIKARYAFAENAR